MRVNIDVVYTGGAEGARPPDDTVDLVPLGKQQLCKVLTVLSGYSCDECRSLNVLKCLIS